jgi:predicted PurR-regulated permease PerM
MGSTDKVSERFSNLRLWQIQPLRDLAGVVFIGCTLWLLFDFRRLFAPVLIAIALAYLCDPLMQAATRKLGLPRWILAGVFTLMLVTGAVLLVIWVGPLLSDQVEKLAVNIPQYAAAVEKRYGLNVGNFNDNVAAFADGIRESPVETLAPLFTGTGRAVGVFSVIVAGTMEVLLSALLLPIFFFLFAWHLADIRSGIDALLADGRRARLRRTLRRMDQAVSGFLVSRLLIALMTAAAFVAGWSVTGVPYALLLGILTGLLTIVPYMSIAGWPLALLANYVDVVSSGGTPVWWDVVLWPSVVFLVVAFVEGWILTPWIQSQTMELSALTILLAVLFGGAIGGILGLLLAIPLTACVKIVLEEYWLRSTSVLTAVPPGPKTSS